MEFFVGIHHPSDAEYVGEELSDMDGGASGISFGGCFISINTIRERKSGFKVGRWIMDSGAFTTIKNHGGYPDKPEVYANHIKRWSTNGELLAAVAQDYMCEDMMLEITGLTIPDHQRLTIDRYDALTACDTGGVYIMPVLQGYSPSDYVSHIRQYGERLKSGMWVGVGSVCKRNGDPAAIEEVLMAIKRERPDLRLHGFGVKITALREALICKLLHTADSMAWSFAARMEGRNANDPNEAIGYVNRVTTMPVQHSLFEVFIPGA